MRYTEKNSFNEYATINAERDYRAMVQKLGQLEDIMEKHGINSAEELEHIILNDAAGEQAFREYFETNVMPYRNIEKELGAKLPLFFKIMKAETLWWKDRHKKLHNISSEFITVKPYWSIGAGIMFEFSWNDRNIYAYTDCDVTIKEKESPIGMPHIYLFLPLKGYGKTWALTKEELK